ncbi:MAG: late competence development ComFB family protein [Clostridiaceae bacterium]|nr:late competence development ComFB family protein [Clostridiaceae bacterium]
MMYALKNCMEDIVAKTADECIPESSLCSCAKCRMDVMAIALNNLPPTYVVTHKGELLASIDATGLQNQADVLSAVMNAIHIVKEYPKHDDTISKSVE